MTTILDELVAAKEEALREARARVSLEELRRRAKDARPVRPFAECLRAGPGVAVIAEIKRSSPSAGIIRADCRGPDQARRYEHAGAAAISVLTEESRFGGSLADLQAVATTVAVPVLRKDFLFDPYQIYEARAAGADSVLLIAEVLREPSRLVDLMGLARDLGMEPLVEVYEAENLEWVLHCQPRVIGVNNRDLRTFSVDLRHTEVMAARIPPHCVLVAESGISGVEDVQRLARAGADAVLVGETLMRAPDPAPLIQAFRSVPRGSRGQRDGKGSSP